MQSNNSPSCPLCGDLPVADHDCGEWGEPYPEPLLPNPPEIEPPKNACWYFTGDVYRARLLGLTDPEDDAPVTD